MCLYLTPDPHHTFAVQRHTPLIATRRRADEGVARDLDPSRRRHAADRHHAPRVRELGSGADGSVGVRRIAHALTLPTRVLFFFALSVFIRCPVAGFHLSSLRVCVGFRVFVNYALLLSSGRSSCFRSPLSC